MTDLDLDGRCALVTGAQKGIGRAIAERLGALGAHVVVNHLDDGDAADAIVETIRAEGGRATVVQGDVTHRADVERMVEAGDVAGGIDLLVNNAGIYPGRPFLELTDDDWDAVLAVNLRAAFWASQAVCRRLVADGRAGAIVNLTSIAAYQGYPGGVHYSASKGGLVGFTRTLALELAPHQIRVNAIAPGIVDTDQPRGQLSEAQLARAGGRIPLGRLATPHDVANTAAFLLSGMAAHITGEVVHVNGGSYTGG